MARVVARIRLVHEPVRNLAAVATQSCRVFGHRNTPRGGSRNDSGALIADALDEMRDEAERLRVEAEMDADWAEDRS